MDILVQIQQASDDLVQAKKLSRKKNKLYGGDKKWDMQKYKDLKNRIKRIKDALFYFERGNANVSKEDVEAIYDKSVGKMRNAMSNGRSVSYFFSKEDPLQQKFLFLMTNHAEFDNGLSGFNLTKDHAYFYN